MRTGIFLLSFASVLAFAEVKSVRWTQFDDKAGSFEAVLKNVNQKTGLNLKNADFKKLEERPLATSHYVYFAQVGNGIPLRGRSIQIWTEPKSGELIQAEATVETPLAPATLRALSANSFLSSQSTMEIVRRVVNAHLDDRSIRSVDWVDYWDRGALVRAVRVRGKRGYHRLDISVTERRLLTQSYEEFPQAASQRQSTEFSLPVKVYPIYEEIEHGDGKLLPRIDAKLDYLLTHVAKGDGDPYAPLKQQKYVDAKYDPILGLTEEGRKNGFWNFSFIKTQAAQIYSQLPLVENTFSSGPVALEGRYATINLESKVPEKFKGLNFTPTPSATFRPSFAMTSQNPPVEEMIPASSLRGKPLLSAQEAMDRPARRLPDHDPVSYLNDGFDELQVYWSINRLFDALGPMGFSDPELSTRRFNAYLFDPDISMRDNAFYYEDTINFTTYAPQTPNMARDNTTIWHELGHGVMDRLMGDQLRLADTGGLSEGMADFVAQLVVNDVTATQTYPGKERMRIINKTGFNMTNEVHDDGEAYGGSMNDMLEAAIAKDGRAGLTKISDLIMEAMRLSRNNHGLTANGWYERVLFADQRGHMPLRAPGEFKNIILNALANRNFNLDGSPVASFSLKNGGQEVDPGTPGSRQAPIRLNLAAAEKKDFALAVKLQSSLNYRFDYPVTVKVQYRGGPLQGAAAWDGEAQQPYLFEIKSEEDTLMIPIGVLGKCDEFNRDDKSCVDFAYLQVFNRGDREKPVAKKRFYVRVYPAGEKGGN